MNYYVDEFYTLLSGDNMARELTAYGFQATLLVIPAGISNALLINPIAGEISMSLKYFSGGSLEIFNVSPGATVMPVVTAGQGYLVGSNEIVNSSGCPKFGLVATGATTLAYLLLGLSQPG